MGALRIRVLFGVALAGALLAAGCTPPATVGPSASTPVPGEASGPATAPPSGSSQATPTVAQAWPPSVRLVKVAEGFDHPLYVTSDGTGNGKLYVVEQTGRIRVIRAGGKVEPKPFLDVSGQTAPGGERGLLGLAFSPTFAKDRRFYIDYTDTNGDTQVAAYTTVPSGALATAGPPRFILTIRQPYANHNGGCLQFGPDGFLYIGVGDGGAGGDPGNRAQNPDDLLGKMLRIDVSSSDRSHPYALPYDNAFTRQPHGGYAAGPMIIGGRGEIFLLGLRNPWRFSFDKLSGDLYIGDVGQDAWEEIDVLPRGKGGFNLGWNLFEGDHSFPPGTDRLKRGFTFPVIEYPHPYGESVIGGYVYRGSQYPQWNGLYFYGDEVKQWIGAMRDMSTPNSNQILWQTRKVLDTGFPLSSFGTDDAGEIYACDLSGGAVYHLEAAK